MIRHDVQQELKPKFSDENAWQDFLAFIDSHKVRGSAAELWLQWEIHLLKQHAACRTWNPMARRFLDQDRAGGSTFFQ